MRDRRIWPTACPTFGAMRFGLMLLVSVYRKLGEAQYLDAAEHLVAEVERVLERRRRIRISEAPDRDGQCFHYLAIWLYALGRLGEIKPEYRERASTLARDVHSAFVIPGVGVIWKMKEGLSGPYTGYGLRAWRDGRVRRLRRLSPARQRRGLLLRQTRRRSKKRFEPSVPLQRIRPFSRQEKCRRLDPGGTEKPVSLASGTDGSNPAPSSAESVSAVNSRAVGGEARGFAALCAYTGTREGT